jgi:hypothetical protein
LKATLVAVVQGRVSDSRKAAFCATFSKKVAGIIRFCKAGSSFVSFYKETKPKKIVVARVATSFRR